MPILTGLVFAASLMNSTQDDLINDKHYVVVKNGEQATPTTTKGAAAPVQGNAAIPPVTVDVRGVDFAQGRSVIEVPAMGAPVLAVMGSQLELIPEFARVVSCSFIDASATDVLKWLTKQGVNFAGSSDAMPKSKLSLNLKNVPLHEALDAIAEVFGGVWSVRGKTLVYRPGRSLAMSSAPFGMAAPLRGRVDPKRPYDLAIPPMIEGFELKLDGNGVARVPGFKELPGGLSKEEVAKIQIEIGKAHEEMKKAMEETRTKEVRVGGQLGPDNMGKLLKSLTDKQWDLHKKQGYLKFSDLTQEQLKMVVPNGKVEGKMTLSCTIDGKSLTLKN